MIQINPLTLKKLRRFRSIKRGFWSFIILLLLYCFSLAGELFVNKRALLVSYKGDFYFPTYGDQIRGKQFGLDYDYETDYRTLKKKFEQENLGNWVIMPIIPYDPYEMDYAQDE